MSADRFSVLAVNWVRFPGGDEDVSEPTPRWPLEAVLDGAAAAGFAAVGLDHYTTTAQGRVDDLGGMLSARGLRCTDVGVLPVGEPGVAEAAEQLARTASVTGAKLCIAAFYGPAPDAVRDLRASAEILADAGLRLALEFTAYGELRSLSRASELCEAVGWDRCGLLVDTWHFFRGGAPWPLLRALRGDQIALVHVNDGAPPSGLDGVFEGRFRRLPPGQGTFAIEEFAAALDAAGYDGPISVEVLSTELRRLPPAEGARQLLDSLREAWPA
jgi:sugar phosphate isomerase/epimerase